MSADKRTMDDARTAKKAVLALCGEMPGVGAVGIVNSEDGSGPIVGVFVADDDIREKIPKTMSGVPVVTYLDNEHELY